MHTQRALLSDLDGEMEKRGLQAVVVIGDSTSGNPELLYVAGCRLPRGGVYVKRCGEPPVLLVSHIDLWNASKGRVKDVRGYSDYGYEELLSQDPDKAYIDLLGRIFRDLGVTGRFGLYGRRSASYILNVAEGLRAAGYQVTGENSPTVLESAMEVKDEDEVAKIRDVGRRTAKVVEETLEFLKRFPIQGDALLWRGEKLRVGRVKSHIRKLLAEEDLYSIDGVIFAAGAGSADPHCVGEDGDPVRCSKPIVFDISPQAANGYCFDCTRTFTIRRAGGEIRRMYQDVLECQLLALDSLRDGVPAKDVMNLVCDHFEKRGYRTVRSIQNQVEARREGFIHSLGHGVGLTIGELPYLSLYSKDRLKSGQTLTVEPGLYKPQLGGVRIEDVVVIRGHRVENLTPLEKKLEI